MSSMWALSAMRLSVTCCCNVLSLMWMGSAINRSLVRRVKARVAVLSLELLRWAFSDSILPWTGESKPLRAFSTEAAIIRWMQPSRVCSTEVAIVCWMLMVRVDTSTILSSLVRIWQRQWKISSGRIVAMGTTLGLTRLACVAQRGSTPGPPSKATVWSCLPGGATFC